jgi:hypothetical protein
MPHWRNLFPACKQSLTCPFAAVAILVPGIVHSQYFPVRSQKRETDGSIDAVCVVHDLVDAGGRRCNVQMATCRGQRWAGER